MGERSGPYTISIMNEAMSHCLRVKSGNLNPLFFREGCVLVDLGEVVKGCVKVVEEWSVAVRIFGEAVFPRGIDLLERVESC